MDNKKNTAIEYLNNAIVYRKENIDKPIYFKNYKENYTKNIKLFVREILTLQGNDYNDFVNNYTVIAIENSKSCVVVPNNVFTDDDFVINKNDCITINAYDFLDREENGSPIDFNSKIKSFYNKCISHKGQLEPISDEVTHIIVNYKLSNIVSEKVDAKELVFPQHKRSKESLMNTRLV